MAPSGEPLLSCHGLACGYVDRTVLTGVSLTLRPGSAVALLGPNGAGKSTLLKTLVRFLPPLGGRVEARGAPVDQMSYAELARRVAYVPQEEHPAFDFSALQVVLLGRLPHSDGLFETEEDYRAARRAMASADCDGLADRYLRELSGGERQRVLIARALAQEAPVMLLDEPTAHLDFAHQVQIAGLLRRHAADGNAVMAAVHDLNWASAWADEAILIHAGRAAPQVPLRELLASDSLERAYGVAFERHPLPAGGLWLRAASDLPQAF
jgi:iron complex transport system ATP-binding protein